MTDLGRLERVDLREVWKNEANHFTPWLAEEENIQLLGDTIDVELEVEAQEKAVGSFKADILCKDTANNRWVLIENQLERTDHTHLGQLMTYAAGLDAVTIVWIAQKFTEEHRAALDWLNQITEEGIHFFGLEVELWRIGNSPNAPKFNVVSKPNDWSRTVKSTAEKGELSATEQLQLEYWTVFTNAMEISGSKMRIVKPIAQGWLVFSIGRADFQIVARLTTQRKQIGCYLNIVGKHRLAYYDLLDKDYREVIDQAFGDELEWRRRQEGKESHLELRFDCDPNDRDSWTAQHQWLRENVEKFYELVGPIIKRLDASDYVPQEESDDV